MALVILWLYFVRVASLSKGFLNKARVEQNFTIFQVHVAQHAKWFASHFNNKKFAI